MKRPIEPSNRRPRWEPEPLHLPAPPPRNSGNQRAEPLAEEDPSGSFVVVIEL